MRSGAIDYDFTSPITYQVTIQVVKKKIQEGVGEHSICRRSLYNVSGERVVLHCSLTFTLFSLPLFVQCHLL